MYMFILKKSMLIIMMKFYYLINKYKLLKLKDRDYKIKIKNIEITLYYKGEGWENMNNIIKSKVTETPKVWKQPIIRPVAEKVLDVENANIILNSHNGIDWRFSFVENDEESIIENIYSFDSWDSVEVPGNLLMQGYDIKNDKKYFYKCKFDIPEDYLDKKIILRFNGVYSIGYVWVNGKFVRSHKGGFTTWDCDITDFVIAGEEAILTVAIEDVMNDVSIASHYAHFNIGGINRNVELIALPKTHLTRFHYETDFDDSYIDSTLKVMVDVEFADNITNATLELFLYDNENNSVELDRNVLDINKDNSNIYGEVLVKNPKKWDSEHPYLYTLKGILIVDGKELQQISTKVGFRKIVYGGANGSDLNKIYVNGQSVKLRGSCHHDIHPLLGRTTNKLLDEYDARMFKKLNMNYVRTSHYPPTKEFLDACDRYGIYVEEEIAVCFQYTHCPEYKWQKDNSEWYVGQFSEMIEKDRSHPSVLIWSLGNESIWHKKFNEEYEYLKEVDISRPSKFSYPNQEALEAKPIKYDIYSYHYMSCNGEMSLSELPTIHDEYVHIPCYNIVDIDTDSGVRNFWSYSIIKGWENIVNTDGALGCAIWANIDDVFQIPDGTSKSHQEHTRGSATGYGEWGNYADPWRREKPEAWITKKAYSPIRIKDDNVIKINEKGIMDIKVSNWFNHTNLNEIRIVWSLGGNTGELIGPNVKPYEDGNIEIFVGNNIDADVINLKFYSTFNEEIMVDEFNIRLKEEIISFNDNSIRKVPIIEEKEESISVIGEEYSIKFSKDTGLILEGKYKDNIMIVGGPNITLDKATIDKWILNNNGLKIEMKDEEAIVQIQGCYDESLKVNFILSIDCHGLIEVDYEILSDIEHENLRELGVNFNIPVNVEQIQWKKKGILSVYPKDHIGRNEGIAYKIRKNADIHKDVYRKEPKWPWKDDMRNFFIHNKNGEGDGIVTNDFKSIRDKIYYYNVGFSDTNSIIRVESEGTESARVAVFYKDENTYYDLHPSIEYSCDEDGTSQWEKDIYSQGNKCKDYKSNIHRAYIKLNFKGTGIKVFSKKAHYLGNLKIYVDEVFREEYDCWSNIGDILGQQLIYVENKLPYGEHSIKIEVSGNGGERDYVTIDGFEVIDDTKEAELEARLVVNNKYNYPLMGWGNYIYEPINIKNNYRDKVKIRLTER